MTTPGSFPFMPPPSTLYTPPPLDTEYVSLHSKSLCKNIASLQVRLGVQIIYAPTKLRGNGHTNSTPITTKDESMMDKSQQYFLVVKTKNQDNKIEIVGKVIVSIIKNPLILDQGNDLSIFILSSF